KAKQNVEKVKEHLMAEEIEKLVKGSDKIKENVEVVSSPLRNDDNQSDLGTRLEPRSDKECPEVEKIANISQPVNVIEEEEESAEDDYEHHEFMTESLPKMVDERIKKNLKTQVPLHVAQGLILEREKSQAEVAKMIVDSSIRNYMSGHVLHDDLPIWLALKYKFERLHMAATPCIPYAIHPRDQDDPHDDAHPEGENSAKRQKTSEHGMFIFGESLFDQDYESEPGPSTSVIFPDDDIEERTSKWVKKCVKKFNPYARYNVEHWKNAHAKIFYIKKQQESGKPKEEIYSNSKIVDDYAETGLLWSLSVFIRSTVIWERVHDFQLGVESYQQQVNLTSPIITFPGIEKYDMFFIVTDPVYGIIYENSEKEKRVIRHQEIHKFCDATLKRVLEGFKSYNNDVKYGYVTTSLSKKDVEDLQLFAEEIKERLKHQDQMRRWEIYVNGRPLGSRRERP
ncbi:hypothetical protein Tco_0738214, partial [Tanacetum coccineum]